MKSTKNDIKAEIVDCFEDYLEEKKIILPSRDREIAIKDGEDPKTLAIIYGEDYDIIGDVVDDVLSKEVSKSDKEIKKILEAFLALAEKYDFKRAVSLNDILKLGAKVYKILDSPDVDGPMITVSFHFLNESKEDTTEFCGKSIFDCVDCFCGVRFFENYEEAEILDIEIVYNEDDASYYRLPDSDEKYATERQRNSFNAVVEKIKNLLPRKHTVKILPKWFDDVASGKKNFEIRFDDRNYRVGDTLHLHEWERGKFTGREVTKVINYIYRGDGTYGVSKDCVILGLSDAKAHWIDDSIGDMPIQVCSNCKTFYPLAYTGGGHHFCPSCGREMEV